MFLPAFGGGALDGRGYLRVLHLELPKPRAEQRPDFARRSDADGCGLAPITEDRQLAEEGSRVEGRERDLDGLSMGGPAA